MGSLPWAPNGRAAAAKSLGLGTQRGTRSVDAGAIFLEHSCAGELIERFGEGGR